MKIDVEEILRSLEAKANTIYFDKDRLKSLLNAVKGKIENNKTLMEIWDDIKLFIDLIKDWMKGDYKEISQGSMIMIIISLLYLVNPLDLIPDFLIGGFIDDLAVIAYVIKKTSEELNVYKEWKDTNKGIDKSGMEDIIETQEEENTGYEDEEMNKVDIGDLYWTDLTEYTDNPDELKKIFRYLKDYDSKSIYELSQILKLYSNPSGAFTKEFAEIIGGIYKYNKIRFIKALNLVKDESINLVYIFRSNKIFEDADKEISDILSSNELSREEIDTTNTFFKMYKTICAT